MVLLLGDQGHARLTKGRAQQPCQGQKAVSEGPGETYPRKEVSWGRGVVFTSVCTCSGYGGDGRVASPEVIVGK